MLVFGYHSPGNNASFAYATSTGHHVIATGTTIISDELLASPGEAAMAVEDIATANVELKILDIPAPAGADPNDTPSPAAFTQEYRNRDSFVPAPTWMGFTTLAAEEGEPDHASEDRDRRPVQHLADDDTYTTPNGDPYFPPTVAGHSAVAVLRALRGKGRHSALVGEPGSGKTTLAQVAHGPDLIVQTFNGETTIEDVVGRWVPVPTKPGAFSWIDGPLVRAMKTGKPYLANELARAPMETQAVLLPVMDHQRRILLEAHEGEEIHAADGFSVIVDFNPGSGFGMTDALHSRLAVVINVPTDYDVAQRLGVPKPLVRACKVLQRQNAGSIADGGYGSAEWVPGIRDLLDARDNAELFGIQFAVEALVSACPDPERRSVIAAALGNNAPDPVNPNGLTAIHKNN